MDEVFTILNSEKTLSIYDPYLVSFEERGQIEYAVFFTVVTTSQRQMIGLARSKGVFK